MNQSTRIADLAIRIAAAVSVVVVAAIAAVISYQHAYALVVAHGESGAVARALPLTVDGLIVTCSLVLLDAARRREQAPLLAWLLLWCGIVATLGANVAHGVEHGWVGAIIAGWPALVAVGSFEMLARLVRGGQVHDDGITGTPVLAEASTPGARISTASTAGTPAGTRPQRAPWPAPESAPAPDAMPAPSLGKAPRDARVPDAVAAASARTSGAPAELLEHAAEVFGAYITETGELPGIRRIKEALGVGQPRAREVQAYLRDRFLPHLKERFRAHFAVPAHA